MCMCLLFVVVDFVCRMVVVGIVVLNSHVLGQCSTTELCCQLVCVWNNKVIIFLPANHCLLSPILCR